MTLVYGRAMNESFVLEGLFPLFLLPKCRQALRININQQKEGLNMKVTVKRKSSAGTVHRNLSGDNRWRNAGKKGSAKKMNQRRVIRATVTPRNIRKGA